MGTPITQDRIAVTVTSAGTPNVFDGPWDSISGQEAERENLKLRPGAGMEKQVVSSNLDLSDITVTRLFDAERDAPLLAKLYATGTGAYSGTTITESYLDSDGNTIPGTQIVHNGCAVASFSGPEGDANSSDIGKLTVTFTRTGVTQ